MEIAGPGFINFFIADAFWYRVIPEIHELGPAYGNSDLGAGQKVQVEFVSANPTGPLHIGHGRGAALGDALANLLAATGHQVVREYYINDVGNQILTLGKSLYFRLRELLGEVIEFPEDGYQGGYMKDLARELPGPGQGGPARRRPTRTTCWSWAATPGTPSWPKSSRTWRTSASASITGSAKPNSTARAWWKRASTS